ncbi:MAG: respiratory nitrate reductase subunit gamma [Armatimonadetes bacterium CG_4_10_14_3_um_filter_59_10]|nr:MAG: respiratory nitrate reductase subunit gamma [Armatimonadetes bacterium CG_4_10_14_3_um_filter_59_10]
MHLLAQLFQVFPYVALAVHLVESIRRYRQVRFSYSSLSSQFLEGERLFLGSVPWHYGILLVLGGHLVAFLFPRELLAFNSAPVRLYIIEVAALAGGLISLIGLVNLIMRRVRYPRIRAVTSLMDIFILAVLLVQVGLGVYIAASLRWGSNWYAIALVPYLRSLFAFQPDISLVQVMPLAVKLHIVGAYVVLTLLPFTRLVHFLVVPLQYIGRPPQVVIWNRDPRTSVS